LNACNRDTSKRFQLLKKMSKSKKINANTVAKSRNLPIAAQNEINMGIDHKE
jgi:hypothetical protein